MAFEQAQRTRLASVAILILVFGSGVLLGLALDRSLTAAPATAAALPADAEEDGEEDNAPRYLFERVGLTPDQRVVVDSIVVRHRASMSALRKQFSEEYDPQYWAIILATREEIKDVMTPEQAAHYDSLLAENDREDAEERADSIAKARANGN